jgi:16S rRNA (uracil1498-N3)-methyltransferase
MELFYCNNIEGDKAIFDEQESTHCIRVLRHKAGDELMFTDGNGKKYTGKIEVANARNCILQIEQTEEEKKRDFYLHIAIAPPKAIDRFEWFLEKATELGVEEITPLLCRYSERKHLNNERCGKILMSAMKQSNRLYLPKLNELIKYDAFLKNNFEGTKAIAHCEPSEKKSLTTAITSSQKLLVLIGPEGDFSKEEIETAIDKNFETISLGEKRLRTETAAVHVCSAVSFVTNN